MGGNDEWRMMCPRYTGNTCGRCHPTNNSDWCYKCEHYVDTIVMEKKRERDAIQWYSEMNDVIQDRLKKEIN